MEKQTHCDLILRHMKTYGSISHKEAEREYGCTRLAARISDLRRRGVDIQSQIVTGKDRHGGKTHSAVYSVGVGE